MRHEYIEENQVVDRYLMGRLSLEESEAFEEHLLHCTRCQEEMETSRALQNGLKAAAARGWLDPPAAQDTRPAGRSVPLWTLAAAAALAALLILPPIYLFLQMNTLDRQLADTRLELEQARRVSQQHEDEAERLNREIQALQAQLGQEDSQVREQLEQERQARRLLAANLQRLQQPHINTPVIPLDALRSSAGEGEAATVVRAQPDSGWIVLALLLDRADYADYRVALTRQDEVVWQSGGLRPNYRDELVINLPRPMLREGPYQVTVEGMTESGQERRLARYAFTYQPAP
ncbi:MAG TPA: zf-HC2 domain-containing protein [Acidobacteriota bacterium]|nr:zf-HC2 domain-containing protein [Acidobacteriota bacterium]